jgi:hypothetical protein
MMVTVRARDLVASGVFLSICLLAACSREQQDWRAAEGADTMKAYGQFIEHHPDSELTTEARTRIAQLGEDRDWQQAASAGTASAFQQFLAQHPNGKWSQEARIRVESFALVNAATNTPGAAPTLPTLPTAPAIVNSTAPAIVSPSVPLPTQAFSQTPPSVASNIATAPAAASPAIAPPQASAVTAVALPQASVAAAPALALPKGSGATAGFGIQLGAFSSEEKANSEWAALAARFPSQLHGLTPRVVSADTTSGRLFRLQASASSETLARTICDELKQQSQGCVPLISH